MAGRTVHLRIGGQTYRVMTSASDEELQKLAAVVDQKIAAVVPPGRMVTPQAMLLAAMALAHDLEVERGRSAEIKAKARGAFSRMIERVDAALGPDASSERSYPQAAGALGASPVGTGLDGSRPANEP
jgi:cell division protein ZapA